MTLPAGTRLGPYEILALLGAGGMGEVYRARDTRLGRGVAIKVLPAAFASDADRLARFERENRAIATLSHPNIRAILDVTRDGDTAYAVMELLEGQTLRDRLASGALPPRKAIALATQMSEGLAAAHDKGIAHRDLKPENLFLTRDDRVKILDFGLAKVLDPHGDATTMSGGNQTTAGTVLGTAGYMAPEQVRGLPVDHRADIFACGAVMYEMVSGRRAFAGETDADTLSAILNNEPPEIESPAALIAPALERIIRRCLEKRPEARFQSAHDLAFALETIGNTGGRTRASSVPPPVTRRWRVALYAIAGVALIAAVSAAIISTRAPAFVPYRTGAMTLVASTPALEFDPAISADGKFIAYAASTPRGNRIFVRQVDGGRPVLLTGDLDGAHASPKWSPDGTRIVFEAGKSAYIVPALGGPAVLMVSPTEGGRPLAPAWSPDGLQLSYVSDRGIWVEPIDGSAPARLAIAGEQLDGPTWSPDGRRIAFLAGKEPDLTNVGTNSLWTADVVDAVKPRVQLTDASLVTSSPVWAPDGLSLLYISNAGGVYDIYQQRVTADGAPVGDPARITTGLDVLTIGMSGDGSRLVYSTARRHDQIWMAPMGPSVLGGMPATPITTENQHIECLGLSPDGLTIAYDSDRFGNHDIFTQRIDGGEPTRITTHPGNDFCPSWSPDGREIVFHSMRAATRDVFVVSADGRQERAVTSGPHQDIRPSWLPDGGGLVFGRRDPEGDMRVAIMRRASDGTWAQPRTLSGARPSLSNARVSPDGTRIAFADREGISIVGIGGGDVRPFTDAPLSDSSDVWRSSTLQDSVPLLEWLPDGEGIVFIRQAPNARNEFWTIPAVGGDPRPLLVTAGSPRATRREFATDGRRLFYISGEAESDIGVMDLKR